MSRDRRLAVVACFLVLGCGQPLWTPRPPVPPPPFGPPDGPRGIHRIVVSHHGCFGTCPIYAYDFTAQQEAVYRGICHTTLRGRYEAPLDSLGFEGVARALLASDFFYRDNSGSVPTDAPYVVIEVHLVDGRARSVVYASGTRLPLRIEALAKSMDWHFVARLQGHGCAA